MNPLPPIPSLHSPPPRPLLSPALFTAQRPGFSRSWRRLSFRGSADTVSKLGRTLGLWIAWSLAALGLAGLQPKPQLEPPPASIKGRSITEPGLRPGRLQPPGGQCRDWPKCQWIDSQEGVCVTEVREGPGTGVGAGPPEVTLEKAIPMRSRERAPTYGWALTWVGAARYQG